MTGSDNADAKWSENSVDGEDSWRTASCLRGRLLAERMASRNAREEAEQLETRLLEVEALLKKEAKSRNKAERKLRFLMKRLECMEISYVADESEQSVNDSQLSLWSSTSSVDLKNDECEKGSKQNSTAEEQRMEACLEGEGDRFSGSSMALVPVNAAAEEDGRRSEGGVVDATVKQVLESLRRAKEQLQGMGMGMSMSMIKVG